ncbi:substrate-binding domain-containing protein [Leisingera daeponensis]|uniref:substrate-binding domain-containing protein n=1 Tax=Leisingera daeponensis TaxID=405746 RepID=UPI001C95CB2D|nr:substrate-binding domain-containing protein [Leisingera daeponensis]MBY6058887.1 substrate-binding domain-containing protein [Leisingera daeponensis]
MSAIRRKNAFAERFEQVTGRAVIQMNFAESATLARGRAGLATLQEERKFEGGFIFCSSDVLAHGVLIEARARGLRVPQEIAVMGFADQEFAADVEPAITTIRVDRDAFGHAAADAILLRLAGRAVERSAINLGFEIVRRASA